jgi:hypothetical protein
MAYPPSKSPQSESEWNLATETYMVVDGNAQALVDSLLRVEDLLGHCDRRAHEFQLPTD